MNSFEKALAIFLGILALPILMWSYNHWMQVTGPGGTYSPTTAITGSPSISGAQIDKVLCDAKSPACGTGYTLYNFGAQYGIDPAFALAVFKHESSYGTAGVAVQTHSLGNLRCISGYPCENGFAAFSSWPEGYTAFYKLISGPLYVGAGLTTPEAIMARYAPVADGNDPAQYASDVESSMRGWRTA